MDGQMCKYFKNNCCLKGEDCLFSHALSTFPCKFFHTRGHCLDMESCRFSHEVQLLKKIMIFQVIALESSLLWDSFVIFLTLLISHYFPKCPLSPVFSNICTFWATTWSIYIDFPFSRGNRLWCVTFEELMKNVGVGGNHLQNSFQYISFSHV